MNFFKKTSVAVVLTCLIIALCCVWGYTRVYVTTQSPETNLSAEHRSAGESNLNYYLDWIDDNDHLFSADTIDAIARENLVLDSTYSSLLAIHTTNYLNGENIQVYTERLADKLELGSRDMLLVLDSNTQNWYVVYGGSLGTYIGEDSRLPKLFSRYLGANFFVEEKQDETILSLFDDLKDWYKENLPANDSSPSSLLPSDTHLPSVTLGAVISGILFTLLANIWWILILLVFLNWIDRVRLERHLNHTYYGAVSPSRFHPFLFWHQPGSRWYQRMVEEEFYEDDDDGFGGPDGPGPTDNTQGPDREHDGFGDGPNGTGEPDREHDGFGEGPAGGFAGDFQRSAESAVEDLTQNTLGFVNQCLDSVQRTINRFFH